MILEYYDRGAYCLVTMEGEEFRISLNGKHLKNISLPWGKLMKVRIKITLIS